jgi:LmbE family N-acetylglucosaminyl deacetylase
MSGRVLVIAPHPDDEAIGCGGAIRLHRRRGDEVRVVFLSSGERCLPDLAPETVWAIREEEARRAAAVLGLASLDFLRLPDQGVAANAPRAAHLLRHGIEVGQPDLLYFPHPLDAHPDHQAVLAIVRLALAGWKPLPQLRAYEVWSPLPRADRLENVSAVMADKLRAIRCYASQLQLVRYDRAVRGLNQYRGLLAGGVRYAEAFQERGLMP